MQKIFIALIGLILAGSLAGCNTFSGAGKDLQQGGKAITHAANANKAKPSKYSAN